ncbi:DUF3850 domain-containing protein [Enterococcus faecalis]|nr:DUF3850 domain-containing protein [Enterococcus faecalis]ELT8948108.1 DUF3850 domain-containing protein [Enterococcus faecalis]
MKEVQKIYEMKMMYEIFKIVISGKKRFVICKNKGYQVGDILRLKEYQKGKYTGNVYVVEITCITNYSQQDNFVVLGIK